MAAMRCEATESEQPQQRRLPDAFRCFLEHELRLEYNPFEDNHKFDYCTCLDRTGTLHR